MVKKISFILYLIVTVVLASTTVVEKTEGTTFVQESIYSSWWFYTLWAAMSIFAAIYIIRSKLYRELSTFMLHASFGLMLIGALTTALTDEKGSVYLEQGCAKSSYVDDDNMEVELPFTITLRDFKVEYYSGTKAAADYISYLSFDDIQGSKEEASVSMNKIANYKGYRFYQSQYDAWGSLLSVSRDIYGIPITYGGYLLLCISLIWMLISPRGAFRRLLRSPILRRGAMVLICTLTSSAITAKEQTSPHTLTMGQVEALRQIQVVHNQRVMPLTTLAHDFTLKLIGDTEYLGASSEQFFWGWLLFPTEWEGEAIFDVPLSEKQEFLELRKLSAYEDFFTEKKLYKLNHYIRYTDKETQGALYKELMKLNEKVQLVAMLRSGSMFKIFPHRDSTNLITWYSPADELPSDMEQGQALFIKNSVDMLLRASASSDPKEFEFIVSKIVSYQQKYGEESLITGSKVRAEQWYYAHPVTKILYRLNLLIGILGMITLITLSERKKVEKAAIILLKSSVVYSACVLTLYIGLKWYITGRAPLVNVYDTMIFLGWCVSIITIYVSRNSSLFTAMGTLLVGFTMLVATIGGMNPQITPLMPVLNSPFLTTHVCFIMLSYTLFAFTFINGILALTSGRRDKELLQRVTLFSKIFLILGIAALSVGIFIGAVWANVSWGRYWAWDPKEVWALITMMLYALPLHSRSLSIFRREKIFHIYMVAVFAAVLMTYFGVNYILGGMHSYAN